jgi:hypothetical protein
LIKPVEVVPRDHEPNQDYELAVSDLHLFTIEANKYASVRSFADKDENRISACHAHGAHGIPP